MKDKLLPYLTYRCVDKQDVYSIDPHECYIDNDNCIESVQAAVANGDIAYTILDPNGSVLAVMGMTFIHPRATEVWAYASKNVTKFKKHYSHATKFLVEQNFEMLQLNRIQVIIKADQKWAERWATFLGFEKEGVLRNYGYEAKDHFIFSKVRL